MRATTLLLSLSLAAAGLHAQNLVTNGDFSAGTTGWTLGGGYSYNPIVETFDVSGLGASSCFACSPGGAVTPPPYAPNTLEQSIVLVPTIVYELSADICTKNENTSTVQNVDAGRIAVEIGGSPQGIYNFVTGASGASGNITGQWVWRAKLALRVTAATAGSQPLTFKFERSYLSNPSTPRVRITNIQLRFAPNQPTFSIDDNLRLNRTVALRTRGIPNAQYAVIAAPLTSAVPITIPGISGFLNLDPATLIYFTGGLLDGTGFASTPVLVPNNINLTLASTFFQPIQVSGSGAAFGFHYGFVFTNF